MTYSKTSKKNLDEKNMTLYEQSRPGRATPNPIYKPGKEAAARKSSRGSGSSNQTASSSGSGSSNQTAVVINPENIIKSDIAGINQVAISGGSSQNIQYKIGDKIVTEQEYAEKRESELNPQPVVVAVDYAAVKQYNQYMASQGINNAGEYFEAVRNPQTDQITVTQTPPQLKEASSYPQRRISPEETQPESRDLEFKDPFPARPSGSGSVMNILQTEPRETMKRTPGAEMDFQIGMLQENIESQNQPGNILNPLLAGEHFVYDFGAAVYGFLPGLYQLGKATWETKNPFTAIETVGNSMSQQAEKIVTATASGDVVELSGEVGSLYAQYKIPGALKDIKAASIGKWGKAISEAESQLWIKEQSAPVENPLFKTSTLYNDLEISNANPNPKIPDINTLPREQIRGVKTISGDPLAEYYLIPSEYTEIGKNFNKGEAIINPGEASDIKPGTIMKALQPTDYESKLFYKEPGNKPPELQTRLSIEEAPPSNIIRSPQDIIELGKGSEQMKLGKERGSRTNFFENPERKLRWEMEEALKKAQIKAEAEYKAKLSAEADARNKNIILSTQPLAAAGMIIMEEWPRISDILKEKYAIYKGESLREGNIIIREAPITGGGKFELVPIISTQIQNPTKTGSKGGTTSIIKYQPATKIDTAAKIRIRSITATKNDQAQSQRQRQEQEQAQIQGQILIQGQSQTQAQAQAQIQIQGQQQAQKQIYKQVQITTLKNTPPPETPAPFIFPKANQPEKKKRQSGITVKVRRGGIFQNMGIEEDIPRARSKAENIVRGTAAASYKLERSGRAITDFNPGRAFNPSKKEPGVFIQKRSNRISSPGEKSEITNKGIIVSKYKRTNRRRNPWAF